jgi:hypothetical protein
MKKSNAKNTLRWVIFMAMITGVNSSSAQEIAFAFSQPLAPSASLDGMARAKMLINNLARVNVAQAMLLIHTKDINEKNRERLMFYDDAGQLLVNAGANYSLYSRAESYLYAVDILKANVTLSPYVNYRQHIYFPYLYEGGDSTMLQQVQNFLAERGYQPTYTTYQANDDYLDQLYQARIRENRRVDIGLLQKAYVKMLTDDILAYDAKARLMLGYSPRQVVLLHANDLAAYCIIGLVDALTEKGFHIISPEKIFSDPVANPFFSSGYSAVSYMPAITGFPEPMRNNLYVLTDAEKQKVHGYLIEQGLNELLPL